MRRMMLGARVRSAATAAATLALLLLLLLPSMHMDSVRAFTILPKTTTITVVRPATATTTPIAADTSALLPSRAMAAAAISPLLLTRKDGDDDNRRSLSRRRTRVPTTLEKRRSPFKLHNPNPSVFEDQDSYDRRHKNKNKKTVFSASTTFLQEEKGESSLLFGIGTGIESEGGKVATSASTATTDSTGLPRRCVTQTSRTDAGTLTIRFPPKGTSANSLLTGAVSVAFLSAIAPATASVGLLMVPLWAAGGFLAKSAALDPYIGTELEIGQYAWALKQTLGNRKILSSFDGATADIGGVAVGINNQVRNDSGAVIATSYKMELYRKDGVHGAPISFGHDLSLEELEYLAKVINEHLDKLRDGDGNAAFDVNKQKEVSEFDKKKRNKDGFYLQ